MKRVRKAREAKRSEANAPVGVGPEMVAPIDEATGAAITDLLAQIPEDRRQALREGFEKIIAMAGDISLFELFPEPDDLEWQRLHRQLIAELGPLPRVLPPGKRMSVALANRIEEWSKRRREEHPVAVDQALILQWIKEQGASAVPIRIDESNKGGADRREGSRHGYDREREAEGIPAQKCRQPGVQARRQQLCPMRDDDCRREWNRPAKRGGHSPRYRSEFRSCNSASLSPGQANSSTTDSITSGKPRKISIAVSGPIGLSRQSIPAH